MTPEFTVLIPTRGDSEHLRAALVSAIACAPGGEILLAHDRRPGEEPLSTDIVRDPRVRIVQAQTPGPAAVRNAAIRVARGRYLAFLDDDDVWLSHHLRWSIDLLERHPAAILVASDAFFFEDSTPRGAASPPADPTGLPRFRPFQAEREITLRELLLENPILTPTVVLRREQLGSEDLFDEDLPVMEDYDLWLRLARRHTLVFDPRPGVLVRRRTGSASRDWRRVAESSLLVIDRVLRSDLPERTLSASERRRRLGRLWHDLAYACFVDDDLPSARQALGQSVRRLPLLVKNYIYFLCSILPGPVRRAVFSRGRRVLEANVRGGTAKP